MTLEFEKFNGKNLLEFISIGNIMGYNLNEVTLDRETYTKFMQDAHINIGHKNRETDRGTTIRADDEQQKHITLKYIALTPQQIKENRDTVKKLNEETP